MPKESERLAAAIVRDAGGKVVGRTRLQKLAYLLERTGLGVGFEFEYRHYGPFSEELASATRRAALLDLIDENEEVAAWGGRYSVFSSDSKVPKGVESSRLALASAAVDADAVELELAATAAFLASQHSDPWAETERRKPEKAAGGRLEKARTLYRRLATIKTPKPLPKI